MWRLCACPSSFEQVRDIYMLQQYKLRCLSYNDLGILECIINEIVVSTFAFFFFFTAPLIILYCIFTCTEFLHEHDATWTRIFPTRHSHIDSIDCCVSWWKYYSRLCTLSLVVIAKKKYSVTVYIFCAVHIDIIL